MKNKSKSTVALCSATDEEVRDYAYHLYEQSGRLRDHDLDNWLEAKACLEANIPKQHAHARLHRHRHPEAVGFAMVAVETDVTSPTLLLMTPDR